MKRFVWPVLCEIGREEEAGLWPGRAEGQGMAEGTEGWGERK